LEYPSLFLSETGEILGQNKQVAGSHQHAMFNTAGGGRRQFQVHEQARQPNCQQGDYYESDHDDCVMVGLGYLESIARLLECPSLFLSETGEIVGQNKQVASQWVHGV
jgi:hypothetical protein